MAKKNNRTCIVCGENYTFCPTCADTNNLKMWKNIYHNENCKDIFNTSSDYLSGAITKEEARKKFDSCDLSYLNKLHYKIIEAINDVYGKKVKTKKSVEDFPGNKE
jgi:hypothetical protein